MSVDKTKVLNGPFNLTMLDAVPVTLFSATGRKKDSISFSAEPQFEELEDGSKDVWGHLVTCEITISELDTTDLASAEDSTITDVKIEFQAKSKTITITTPSTIMTAVDGLKTKITVEKLVIGTIWTDVFTIT